MAAGKQEAGCVCLVTIHGMGFEQRPTPGEPGSGYADMLHADLCERLNAGGAPVLSDDPRTQRDAQRAFGSAGAAGPVYVESQWPPTGAGTSEAGLSRLGIWRNPAARRVTGGIKVDETAAICRPRYRMAHVALVYSNLEDQGSHAGAAVDAALRTVVSSHFYERGLTPYVRFFEDIVTAIRHGGGDRPAPARAPSLRARGDIPAHHALRQLIPHLGAVAHAADAETPPDPHAPPRDGVQAIFGQLVDDVATYIVREELRQRVRGFVREALLRLIYRRDVERIVINAHSQGTVVAYDVLRDLQPEEARKVTQVVTMGSPVRKYVRLFQWGADIGAIREVGYRAAPGVNAAGEAVAPLRWTNLYDPQDPAADPLRPDDLDAPAPPDGDYTDAATLLTWRDPATGATSQVAIDDRSVDNVKYSYGGLRAHNYWDNTTQVIPILEGLLRGALEGA